MSESKGIPQGGIFFSCTAKRYLVKQHFIAEQVVIHVFAGKLLIATADKNYTINEGETVLLSRNSLAKITKIPAEDGAPYRSATVSFTTAFLQQYYATHVRAGAIGHTGIQQLKHHPLLDSLFTSILPYETVDSILPEEITQLKLVEAISILQSMGPHINSLLSDFAAPVKIDLAAFMHKNYCFAIPAKTLAYLTGRSLATFKRDFQKLFQMPPQKWLHQKRLEQAHYLITEKKQHPSSVYLAVGFENLSHFSFAFKQAFGYNPSEVL